MEFFNIQKMLNLNINFSQFDFKNMSNDEKEMLVSNLKSKITKHNNFFERLIEKQDELSNKHILLHIQYLLDNGYSQKDIKIIIQNIKNIYQMTEKNKIDEIESLLLEELNEIEFKTEEKDELIIDEKINILLRDLSIEGLEQTDDETIIYINNFNNENYNKLIEIFRLSLKTKYNLINFFQRLTIPMFNNKFSSIDIIKYIIESVGSDENISNSLKTYIFNEIVNFMTNEEEEN